MKIYNKLNIKILALIALISVFACEREGIQTLEEKDWNLVWSDEFDGESGSLPDSSIWSFDLGNGDNGWGNEELQSYTNDTTNVKLDGEGKLIITALQNGTSFTSARIKSKGKYSKQYGRIEASIMLPYGPGIWPAFWMLGNNIDEVSWPQCGEIDIMEYKGQEPNIVHGSLHGPGYSGGNPVTESYYLSNNRFDTDFHLFAIEWDEEKIDFFVDDYLYQRVVTDDVSGEWVYNKEFFILLNLAVGGNYVGFPTADTPFPQTMKVDYIRVYELNK